MSFDKFETDSHCAGGRYQSATKHIYGAIASKGSKVIIGYCSKCRRKKPMTVSDNTKKVEGLGDFFKNLTEKGLYVSKKWQKTY